MVRDFQGLNWNFGATDTLRFKFCVLAGRPISTDVDNKSYNLFRQLAEKTLEFAESVPFLLSITFAPLDGKSSGFASSIFHSRIPTGREYRMCPRQLPPSQTHVYVDANGHSFNGRSFTDSDDPAFLATLTPITAPGGQTVYVSPTDANSINYLESLTGGTHVTTTTTAGSTQSSGTPSMITVTMFGFTVLAPQLGSQSAIDLWVLSQLASRGVPLATMVLSALIVAVAIYDKQTGNQQYYGQDVATLSGLATAVGLAMILGPEVLLPVSFAVGSYVAERLLGNAALLLDVAEWNFS